jgi:hypothetical protein
VARIKEYRPDRHPREFTRIRRAWEDAQEACRLGEAEARFESEHEAVGPVASELEPEAAAVFSRTWEAAVQREFDAARRGLETLVARPAHASRAWAHRFLLEEMAGIREPERVWAAALERDVDVASWMDALLDPAERRRVAGALPAGWTLLRRGSSVDWAHRMLRARVHDLLWRGEGEAALAEVTHPTFRHDATDAHPLARIAQEIASALAWTHPARARSLLDAFPTASEDPLQDHILLALRASDAWGAWAAAHADLDAFQRFVRLGSIADDDEILGLSAELWTDFRRRPDAHFAAFQSLPDSVVPVYLDQIAQLCERHEVEVPEAPETLGHALREADVRAYPRLLKAVQATTYLGSLAGCIAAVAALGWWSVPIWVAALLAVVGAHFALDAYAYSRSLRPALVRYVIESGASPEAIDAWIADAEGLEHLDSMRSNVSGDTTLSVIHATTRLADVLPALQRLASG